jgi:hypothetical protein
MNKISIIVIFIIFCNITGFSQNTKRFSYKLGTGTTLSVPYQKDVEFHTTQPLLFGSNKTEYKPNFGYFVEGLLSYHFNPKYSLTSGLIFKHISYKIHDGRDIFYSKGTLSNSYLNIPISINYRINNKFSISTGPYLGVLLSAQENGTTYIDHSSIIVNDPNDPLLKPEQDYCNQIKNDYHTLDYGLTAQFSYDFSVSKRISGYAFSRFNCGLKNVLSTGFGKTQTMHSAAHDWLNFNISVGLGIKLRKAFFPALPNL